MENKLGKWYFEQFSYADKILSRSLTYFKTIKANFDVSSGLIFAVFS